MALGFHTEGRPEDAAAQRCAMTVGSRIRAASRLTRVGRQTVGPVRSEGCLDQILLWRSRRLPKLNGLGKRYY
jgi:hypothetical protein